MSSAAEHTDGMAEPNGKPSSVLAKTSSPPGEGVSRPRRRFAPQLEETSVKSHRKGPLKPNQQADDTSDPPSKSRRRFAPQLEETSVRSHHKASNPPPRPQPNPATSSSSSRPRAHFTPQLIDTAQRSRRRGDTGPQHRDKTDHSPGDAVPIPRHVRLEGNGASHSHKTDAVNIEAPASRFSYASLSRSRRSSVRQPTLECIHSSESEDSKVPSLSHSPSAKSDASEVFKHATRIRESCDERFAGYLLAHAARVAEHQLKDQAMAAYPNESLYEPADHFAGDRDSDNSGSEQGVGMLTQAHSSSNLGSLKSAAGWDASEMQRHKDALEQQRRAQGGPERKHEINEGTPSEEISQMRNAAKPPLLGGSLVFPSCPSPKMTHIDAYQKPRSRHYDATPCSRQQSGLWTPGVPSPVVTRKSSTNNAGLWGGCCDAAAGPDTTTAASRLLQSGLLTPAVSTPTNELADPFITEPGRLSPFMHSIRSEQLPATPPPSLGHLSGIDAALSREAALDVEFPDSFVTQVYNYLSLGYPALAWSFDLELSKISKLSLEEIRRDDRLCDARGYIGAPENEHENGRAGESLSRSTTGENSLSRTTTAEGCGRWRALKLYVREWGRQEARMQEYDKRPGRQIVRRGSWLA